MTGLIDTQYQTSRYIGFDYQPAELAPSVWTSNGQISISPDVGNWTLAAYVRNIEDRRFILQTFNGSVGGFLAPSPRRRGPTACACR